MPMSGSIARTAVLGRATAGTTTPAGSGSRTRVYFKRAVSGAKSFTGAVSGATGAAAEAVAGVLSFAGSLTKRAFFYDRSVTGTLSPGAGAVTRTRMWVNRTLSGALTYAGSGTFLATVVARLLSGAITPAGALARRTVQSRAVSGSISFVGSLVYDIVAAVFMVGTLTWRRGTDVLSAAGSLAFGGTLTRFVHFKRQVLGKHLTMVDGVSPLTLVGGGKILLVGQKVLSFSSTLTRSLGGRAISIAAALNFSSTISRVPAIGRTLAGSLSPTGALSRFGHFIKRAISILSFDGALSGTLLTAKHYLRTVTGTLMPAGNVLYEAGQKIYGVLAVVGTLTKKALYRRLGGTGDIDMTGEHKRSYLLSHFTLTGVLNPRGYARKIADFVKKGLMRMGFNISNR